MNKKMQKLSAWAGLVAMGVFFAGLIIMTFFPPLPPSLTPEQVMAIYQAHSFEIRLGGLLIVISAMFCGRFDAAILLQLKRMESTRPIGAYGQLASGIANIQFFILPGVLFVLVGFRPDRSIDSLYVLNDLAWIVTMLPWA